VRAAAWDSMSRHAEALVPDIEAAKASRGIGDELDARSLSRHTLAVVQGAFILAKASGDPATGAETVRHLRRYIEMLFGRPAPPPNPEERIPSMPGTARLHRVLTTSPAKVCRAFTEADAMASWLVQPEINE